MSIREAFPLRKRRSSYGEKTPRRRTRFLMGRTPGFNLNESMNTSLDGEPEITWDNNSPSPMKCSRLASRTRKKGQHVSDVSEIVKRITGACSNSEESANSGRPSTPTLLGVWMSKDSGGTCESVDVVGKSGVIKPISQTPVRRRNKRKIFSGKPTSIRSSQVTKYMKKLIEETEAQELMDKGEEDDDDAASHSTSAVNSDTDQPQGDPGVVIEISDNDDDGGGGDKEKKRNVIENSKELSQNCPNESLDLFGEAEVDNPVDKTTALQCEKGIGHKEGKKETDISLDSKAQCKNSTSNKTVKLNSPSQDELWDDDDFFCDDSFLRQATQIEIQCSQMEEKHKGKSEDFAANCRLVTSTPLTNKNKSERINTNVDRMKSNTGNMSLKNTTSTTQPHRTYQFNSKVLNSTSTKGQTVGLGNKPRQECLASSGLRSYQAGPTSKAIPQPSPATVTARQGFVTGSTNRAVQQPINRGTVQSYTAVTINKSQQKPLTGKGLNSPRMQTRSFTHSASVTSAASQSSKTVTNQFQKSTPNTTSQPGVIGYQGAKHQPGALGSKGVVRPQPGVPSSVGIKPQPGVPNNQMKSHLGIQSRVNQSISIGTRSTPMGHPARPQAALTAKPGAVSNVKPMTGHTSAKSAQFTSTKPPSMAGSKNCQTATLGQAPKANFNSTSACNKGMKGQSAAHQTVQPLKTSPNQLTTTANIVTTTSPVRTQDRDKPPAKHAVASPINVDYDLSLTKDDLLTLMEQDDSWDIEEDLAKDSNNASDVKSKPLVRNEVPTESDGHNDQKGSLSKQTFIRGMIPNHIASGDLKERKPAVYVDQPTTVTATNSRTCIKPQSVGTTFVGSKTATGSYHRPLGNNNQKTQQRTNSNQPNAQSHQKDITQGTGGKLEHNNNGRKETTQADRVGFSNSQGSQRCTPEEIERKKKEALQRRQQKIKLSQSKQMSKRVPIPTNQQSSSNGNSQSQRKYSFRKINPTK